MGVVANGTDRLIDFVRDGGSELSHRRSGKIEPLLSRSVGEEGVYVCFTKARVSPSLVDAFSRALKQFKQTEASQAMYNKYFA